MSSWAMTFLVIALIAGAVGLTGVAWIATNIAWPLFVIFLIIFTVSMVLGRRPKDEEALKDEHIKKLQRKIGELVVENDVLRVALKPYPLAREMSDA